MAKDVNVRALQSRSRIRVALIAATATIFLLLACGACGGLALPTQSESREGGWRCTAPDEPVQMSDLVGTWEVLSESGIQNDILFLQEDGTYKQIYVKSNGTERYESAWYEWWIEYRQSGGTYVHFEKMRYCDLTDDMCERPEGGGGDELFYDFCADRVLRMRGEVILAVVSTKDKSHPRLVDALRDMAMLHMKPEYDRGTTFFCLV